MALNVDGVSGWLSAHLYTQEPRARDAQFCFCTPQIEITETIGRVAPSTGRLSPSRRPTVAVDRTGIGRAIDLIDHVLSDPIHCRSPSSAEVSMHGARGGSQRLTKLTEPWGRPYAYGLVPK